MLVGSIGNGYLVLAMNIAPQVFERLQSLQNGDPVSVGCLFVLGTTLSRRSFCETGDVVTPMG